MADPDLALGPTPAPLNLPAAYDYPPMWHVQATQATRRRQLERWSGIVQAYCRQRQAWRLAPAAARATPLFRHTRLRKTLPLPEAVAVVDWMASAEGLRRAEWIGRPGEQSSAWIYWRRPEEWADVIYAWVEATGQKNTVLTLYELTEGDATLSQGGRDLSWAQRIWAYAACRLPRHGSGDPAEVAPGSRPTRQGTNLWERGPEGCQILLARPQRGCAANTVFAQRCQMLPAKYYMYIIHDRYH